MLYADKEYRNGSAVSDNTEYKFHAAAGHGTDSSDVKRPCLSMIQGDFIGQVYELGEDVTMIGYRYWSSLSLVEFDIDHFKSVNDNHGHPAG